MAGVILHHGNQHQVLGVRHGCSDDEVIVTVQNDAAYIYKHSTQSRQHALVLGGSHLQFAAPVVYDATQKAYVAALRDTGGTRCHLASCSVSSTAPPPSFAASSCTIQLEGAVFSLHTLQQPGARPSPTSVAVVMKDGQVGVPDWTRQVLSVSHSSPNRSPVPTTLASSQYSNTLCVITQQQAREAATMLVFVLSPGSTPTGKVSLARTVSLPRPSPNAVPVACCSSTHHSLCFWSDNTLSCIEQQDGQSISIPTTQQTRLPQIRQLKYSMSGRNSISAPSDTAAPIGSQPSNGSTPTGKPTAKSKKRKNATTPEPTQDDPTAAWAQTLVCTAVSDTQFVVLGRPKPGTSQELTYAVVNAKFARVQSHEQVSLNSLPAAVHASSSMQGYSSNSLGVYLTRGECVLALAGLVLSIHLELPPSGLASIVGLSASQTVKSKSNSETVEEIVWQDQPAGPLTKSVVPVATVGTLDIEKLMLEHLSTGVGDELELTVHEDESGASGETEDEELGRQLMERLRSGGDAETLRKASEFMVKGSQERRGYAGLLLQFTVEGLAQHSMWQELNALLASCPLTNLECVPDLITTLLDTHQYQTISMVLRSATDLNHNTLAAVLKHYTSHAAGLKPARSKHRKALIAAAEQLVQAAEDNPSKIRYQKKARCAAVLVSGFTATEVMLHPLVCLSVDPTILGMALACLSVSQAMFLLRYLDKWVHKYQYQLPGDEDHVKLPNPLLYPSFAQVVDWLLALLDVHMTKLSWNDGAGELLVNTRGIIGACMKASQKVLPLSGMLDHCKTGGQLPSLHIIPPSMYTVELLNLRVGDYYNTEQEA